jgi:hypothetical protein
MVKPELDNKIDPIREKYYRPLERAEIFSDILFLVSAALSIAALMVNKEAHEHAYNLVQTGFVLSVAGGFILGWLIRFYFAPHAQEQRFKDFVSHAFGVNLIDEKTRYYYTSASHHPARQLSGQLIENAFYSKNTAQRMTWVERSKVAVYALVFGIVVLNRNTNLETIAVVTQIVLSEQILSKWLRTEWVHCRFEQIYQDLFRLFQSAPSSIAFAAISHELLGRYEIAKANACVTLSDRIFRNQRNRLLAEWEKVRTELGLQKAN